jgi:hypothetical protein
VTIPGCMSLVTGNGGFSQTYLLVNPPSCLPKFGEAVRAASLGVISSVPSTLSPQLVPSTQPDCADKTAAIRLQ